ncbi:MAG TPA: hypothetical protein PLI96_08010 [Halothiobacillus sp.]|nr:hypothetical protein [Halothiobacillus sp.]
MIPTKRLGDIEKNGPLVRIDAPFTEGDEQSFEKAAITFVRLGVEKGAFRISYVEGNGIITWEISKK